MQRNRNTEEPDAGNLLVRVCGGAGGVTCRLYPETWNYQCQPPTVKIPALSKGIAGRQPEIPAWSDCSFSVTECLVIMHLTKKTRGCSLLRCYHPCGSELSQVASYSL